jgi:hypothetical protein
MTNEKNTMAYESPIIQEYEVLSEGVLCASEANMNNYERQQNAWEW